MDFYPYQSPYFKVLIAKAPIELGLSILRALFRILSGYALLFLTGRLILLLIDSRSRFLKYHTPTLFLAYAFSSYFVFQSYHPSGFHLKYPLSRIALVIGLLLFAIAALRPNISDLKLSKFKYIILILSNAVLLLLSAPRPWEISTPLPKMAAPRTESIVFLSFDAVPGDLFRFKNEKGAVAPEWQKSRSNALNYTNAYSVTNSTFTSWYSILSGLYPWQSKVETLYPVNRAGVVDKNEFLPELLKQKGYQTVFMTDCATTSTMHLEYGFDRIFQPDRGAFKSAQIVLTALHPLIGLFQWLPKNFIFPEINSYSSPLYSPETFFAAVTQTAVELAKDERPYFLAVHSCLTHRDLTQHLPSHTSSLLASLPFTTNDERNELAATIRWADSNFKQLLNTVEQMGKRPWLFLFSDHGVRIDQKNNKLLHFSHALGRPINRFQFNIPFSVYPPSKIGLESNDLVSLLDLYPTVLDLAQMPLPKSRTGRNLLKSSNENRGLVLSSSVSSHEPTIGGSSILALIKNGKFNSSGEFFFSEKDEMELLSRRSIAYLKLPYRLILDDEDSQLFDEVQDPHHKTDLSRVLVEKEWELKAELCSQFPLNPCPNSVPKLDYFSFISSASASAHSPKQSSKSSPMPGKGPLSNLN